MMTKEEKLIRLLSTIYNIDEPSYDVTTKELPFYEDGTIYMSEQMTYSEERFYYLIHEFVHHLTDYRHVDFESAEERAFDRLVGVLYYAALLLMSEDDYYEWFERKRDVRDVIDGLFEYVTMFEEGTRS